MSVMEIWQDQSLFPKSQVATISVPNDHELVLLVPLINWRKLIRIAMKCREQRCKRLTGAAPRYRQLVGAVILMAMRGCTYRDAEVLISFYAPARYFCDLMDSEMGLDHVTIFEFTQMLGPSGMEAINSYGLRAAVASGLCDASTVMADTTAQEARISYPNEAGLMTRFMEVVGRTVKGLRGK